MGFKKLNSSKGVTLTELIVSVAILAVIAGPFLSSFMAATSNNVTSHEIISTSAMAQSAMETIKSNQALYLEGRQEIASPDPKYTIEYSIDKDSDNIWTPSPSNVDQYNEYNLNGVSSSVSNSSLIFKVGKFLSGDTDDKVTLNSSSLGGLAVKYTLKLTDKGSDKYGYELTGTAVPITGEFNDNSGDIEVAIQFSNTFNGGGKFNLAVDIDSTITKNVRFYIVDNTGNYLNLTNVGDADFYQYDGLSTSQSQINILYKITVDVKEASSGRVVNQLVSYIKK